MRRYEFAVPLVAVLTALLAVSAAASPLVGVWEIEEIHMVGPDLDATNPEPQPGIYIFTAAHYSMIWNPTRHPRADSATLWHPTDEEKILDFNTLVINSGTYEIKDSTLVVHPLVAKTPEYVGGWATYIFRLAGDTLRLEQLDTYAHDGTEDKEIAKYRTTLTLRRIE